MSLYASFSENANGVFSTVAGKIKDSGDDLWSPIYGTGVQIAFSASQYFQRVQPLILRFLQKPASNPPVDSEWLQSERYYQEKMK